MTRKIPQHVLDQRAAFAAGNKNPKLRGRHESSEAYDVFRRINMHNGDKEVCWEWLGAHGRGTRGEFRPRVAIAQKHYYVYRVVYELYTGYKLQQGDVVRHNCDHPWCCNPYHMIIGTQADNVADMLERERVGLKHFHIKRIMQMLEIGATAVYVQEKMREGYNIQLHVTVIRKIRMRTIYKHIPWPWGDAYKKQRHMRAIVLRNQRLASDPKRAIIDANQERTTTHAKETDNSDD